MPKPATATILGADNTRLSNALHAMTSILTIIEQAAPHDRGNKLDDPDTAPTVSMRFNRPRGGGDPALMIDIDFRTSEARDAMFMQMKRGMVGGIEFEDFAIGDGPNFMRRLSARPVSRA